MKRLAPIVIFVIGQIASVAILVLWIVSHAKSPVKVWWMLDGIFLIVAVIGGSTMLFVFWTKSRVMDNERVNFISSVSHELLTPLASLRLYTETMAMRELPPEKRAEFLDLMLTETDRLASLISQILNASRLERGKALFSFEEHNLAELIEAFIQSNQAMLRDADIRLDLERDCLAMVDQDSFNMVLKNLIENAIRYSPQGSPVRVALLSKGPKLLLRIRDEGEGIEPKQAKKIFKLFYRVSRKKGGTGLGLFIVRMVVRAHKGKVWARSDGLGKGTEMNVLIPAAPSRGRDQDREAGD